MDTEEELPEKPDAVELHHVQGAISMRDVEFGYGQSGVAAPILKDFNLNIEAGTIVAIVGPTGAGKTSISTAPFHGS